MMNLDACNADKKGNIRQLIAFENLGFIVLKCIFFLSSDPYYFNKVLTNFILQFPSFDCMSRLCGSYTIVGKTNRNRDRTIHRTFELAQIKKILTYLMGSQDTIDGSLLIDDLIRKT